MKLLLVGDLHNSNRVPEKRKDDFQITAKEKNKQIVSIAYENNVTAIVQTGDWFDTPLPTLSTVIEYFKIWLNGIDLSEVIQANFETQKLLIEILNTNEEKDFVKVQDLIKKHLSINTKNNFKDNLDKKLKTMIPIYAVAGNHDLYGNNIKTLNRTMFGFLVNIGVINLLSKEKPYILKDKEEKFSLALTGTSYHNDIDKIGYESDYIIEKKEADRHLHVIHGMLTSKGMGDIIRHTPIDKVIDTKADITYSGHDHIGFGPVKHEDKYFLNSGAILRLSANEKEIARMPKVVLADIRKDLITLTPIYLKAAKGEDVFDRSSFDQAKEKELLFENYRQLIRQQGKIEGYNAIEIINSIADNKNFSKDIRDEAIKRVTEAMELLKTGKEV